MKFYKYTIAHFPTTRSSKPSMHTVRATSMADLDLALFSKFGSNYRRQIVLVSIEDSEGKLIKF